jgi:hypothetical protein
LYISDFDSKIIHFTGVEGHKEGYLIVANCCYPLEIKSLLTFHAKFNKNYMYLWLSKAYGKNRTFKSYSSAASE